jgi:hypothetical protein
MQRILSGMILLQHLSSSRGAVSVCLFVLKVHQSSWPIIYSNADYDHHIARRVSRKQTTNLLLQHHTPPLPLRSPPLTALHMAAKIILLREDFSRGTAASDCTLIGSVWLHELVMH